jgi:hypothetical protein
MAYLSIATPASTYRVFVAQLPALCDRCGTIFPSGYELRGVRAYMVGNKSGPCPNCGGMGSVPDAFYEVFDETIRVTTDWTAGQRDELETDLTEAQERDDRDTAIAAIRRRPV